ncbi:diguanylate cyclase (GGDEF) domain-containing protein [Ruminococcaceae bacterium YRB3002]|nr:diguanylate cyclase (GGDEF) domain-containing protein [Ruminococcaceae bacterium YRB3002]
MTLLDFTLKNYGMVFELIGIMVLLFVSAHISREIKFRTICVVGMLFLETILFNLELWTQTLPTLSILRPLLTATIYSIYPVILIVMLQVTTTKLTRKHVLLLMIPEYICIPLFYSSQWTHLVFYYHEDNHYAGGPLADLPYILFGFYALIFMMHNAIYLRHYSLRNRLIMLYIVLGPFIGVAIYALTNSGNDYSALFTSAVLIYFTFIYIHKARTDPMTKLLNRQSLYQDIEEQSRPISGVVSIDMNDLKYLNDNFGHEAGDIALTTIALIMAENCGSSGTPYRIGGDEFIIIYSDATEDMITQAIAVMRRKITDASYTCAFGYAMMLPGESPFDAVKRSDIEMYADKAELKKVSGGEIR